MSFFFRMKNMTLLSPCMQWTDNLLHLRFPFVLLFYCLSRLRYCEGAGIFFPPPPPPLPPLSLFNKGFFRRIFWTDEKSRNDSSLFFLGRRGGKTNILKSWRKIEEDRLVVRTFNSFRFRDTSKKSKKFYYFSFQCSLNINCPV